MDSDEELQREVARLYDAGHGIIEIHDLTGIPVGLVGIVAAIGRAILDAEYIEQQRQIEHATRRVKMCGRSAA